MWNTDTLWYQLLTTTFGDGIMVLGYQWLAHFNKDNGIDNHYWNKMLSGIASNTLEEGGN